MEYPKITIVTICLNSARFIEESIRSVVEQNYPNLEYIIIDGGSTDGTLDIVNKYTGKISVWVSEPDKGPGDAIYKGIKMATGDIMGWLSSDDRLHQGSLFAIAEIFNTLPQVEWVMGFPSWYNAQGTSVNELFYSRERFYYSPNYINDSLYLKFARWSKWRFAFDDFKSIQQESCFWRKSLWEKAGATFRSDIIAYDLELWTRFFQHAQLYTANVLLAGFRIHGNQLSVSAGARYTRESNQLIHEFKRVVFKNYTGHRARLLLVKLLKLFYYYDVPLLKNIYVHILELPPYIRFNLQKQQFEITENLS